jgi:hypothetical protein
LCYAIPFVDRFHGGTGLSVEQDGQEEKYQCSREAKGS